MPCSLAYLLGIDWTQKRLDKFTAYLPGCVSLNKTRKKSFKEEKWIFALSRTKTYRYNILYRV